jgi:hypothetical protein
MKPQNWIDKFAAKHPTMFVVIFGPALIVLLAIWFVMAGVETINMKIKGYNWDSGYGGYYNPKTGDYIKGWI